MVKKTSKNSELQTYVVLSPINHDGSTYDEGEEITLDLDIANSLKGFGVIGEIVTPELADIIIEPSS